MPVEFAWNAPDQTCLIVVCRNVWTAQEILDAAPEANRMIASVARRVDLVINLLDAKNYLPQNSLSHAGKLWRLRHKNVRNIIIVGANPTLKKVFELFLYIYLQSKGGFFIAGTMEEAFDILASHNPQKPPITG